MKRYIDMLHEELIALTDKQVAFLIDLEIAEEGIRPVEAPKEFKLVPPGIQTTEIAYAVKSGEWTVAMFTHRGDAEAVVKMARVNKKYDYRYGEAFHWLVPIKDVGVAEQVFYTEEAVQQVAEHLQGNNRKQKEHDEAKTAYRTYLEATSTIRQNVQNAVSDALQAERERELARKTFARYLHLADNDVATAKRFLREAYKNDPDIIDGLLEEE